MRMTFLTMPIPKQGSSGSNCYRYVQHVLCLWPQWQDYCTKRVSGLFVFACARTLAVNQWWVMCVRVCYMWSWLLGLLCVRVCVLVCVCVFCIVWEWLGPKHRADGATGVRDEIVSKTCTVSIMYIRTIQHSVLHVYCVCMCSCVVYIDMYVHALHRCVCVCVCVFCGSY